MEWEVVTFNDIGIFVFCISPLFNCDFVISLLNYLAILITLYLSQRRFTFNNLKQSILPIIFQMHKNKSSTVRNLGHMMLLSDEDFENRFGVRKPTSDQHLVTACMQGVRARTAQLALMGAGYTNVRWLILIDPITPYE